MRENKCRVNDTKNNLKKKLNTFPWIKSSIFHNLPKNLLKRIVFQQLHKDSQSKFNIQTEDLQFKLITKKALLH